MRIGTLTPGADLALDPRRQMDPHALVVASRNGFPIVAQHVQRRDRLGPLAGLACALVLGGATFWTLSSQRELPRAQPPADAQPKAETLPVPAPVKTEPALVPAPVATPAPQPDPMAQRSSAPTLILDAAPQPKAEPSPVAPSAPATTVATPGAPKPQQPLSADESFAERIGNGNVDTASATRLADPANTVVQGTMISAVLETAVDSDLPGYARAVVSEDVRSFDGTRILIPRASHLIGQYKSGVANGQKRAYVLWSRLIRPDGASVALASPATDFAGNTGLAGEVDTHFFARFGSAVMLSVIDVFAAIGNAAIVVSGAQSAAGVAAQRDGQIPPTIKVPQGSPIRVFTARDLDFAGVRSEVATR